MKLKVVNDYRKHVVLEADTIGNLKSRIMDYFSFKEEDLMSARVLVPDGRDINEGIEIHIVSNCFDLLELEDRSILDDIDGLNDGDTLLIGWKGPFIIRLLSPKATSSVLFSPNPKHDILVDCYTTVGELKRKIGTASGEPVMEDNLPEILFKADDSKQLICFGFYRFVRIREILIFNIYRSRHNKREFNEFFEPVTPAYFDKDGNKPGVRYYDDEKEILYMKSFDMKEGREILIPANLPEYLVIQKKEEERKKMFALMPELLALPPYMGPAPPSMRVRGEHYDYGSPYGPHHLSRPPLHCVGGAVFMLPPGVLYGVPPLMDRFGMPMPHDPMAPRTGSYLGEGSQVKHKARENYWICPTCGFNNNSSRNVCYTSKCKTRKPGSLLMQKSNSTKSKGSSMLKMPDGRWKREKGENSDYLFKTKCSLQSCGAEKPPESSKHTR